jgi:hypothetical protein
MANLRNIQSERPMFSFNVLLFCYFNIPSPFLCVIFVIKIILLYILLVYLGLIIYIHITWFILKHVLYDQFKGFFKGSCAPSSESNPSLSCDCTVIRLMLSSEDELKSNVAKRMWVHNLNVKLKKKHLRHVAENPEFIRNEVNTFKYLTCCHLKKKQTWGSWQHYAEICTAVTSCYFEEFLNVFY